MSASPGVQPDIDSVGALVGRDQGLWRNEGPVGTVASGPSWGCPEDTLMQERFRAATIDIALAALLLTVVGGYLGLYVWIFTKAPFVAIGVLAVHLAALGAVLVRERRRADEDPTEAVVFRPEPTQAAVGFDHPELEADVIDLAIRPEATPTAHQPWQSDDAALASVTPLIAPSGNPTRH